MTEPEQFTASSGDVWQATEKPTVEPRRFYLDRRTDVTGASGTGRVADGVLWPDGTVTIRWRGEHQSTVNWDNIESAERVHGHGGATRIVWQDFAEDERIAEQARLRAEIARLRDGEDTDNERVEGVQPSPGQWLTKFNELTGTQRLRRIEGLLQACDEAIACQQGQHQSLKDELISISRRAGAAEAKLLHAADVLKRVPQTCRFHDANLEQSGMRRGLPKCDSCKQPYRVKRVLAAIEGTE